ncbi:hypothetical protein CVT26_004719 [Gymnopilus dilepis]|uniref:Uncharacterized protein n=1 Tax=Gymnopilus dilepis TaxID=231916 RepID=A0A409XZ76_9AGAR|nr:hypothetical protein CVT26_004719 [Gymnopilus dilepis]
MKLSLSLCLSTLASVYVVSALPFVDESVCPGGEVVVLSESYIGKDKNVKMTSLSCTIKGDSKRDTLVKRQTPPLDVCGANCDTNCFLPAGGGPDPNECHVIADALRYDSQNVGVERLHLLKILGALFTIPSGPGNNVTTNPVVMQYSSCKTFFVNQDVQALEYCRTDWAALIDWVAPNCQATQNAHGGNCVAVDQRWFVQVQHS